MVALIIIGVIVLLIALIMLIPVGADVGYENGELHVSAKACGVLMPLYPKPQEEEKPEKESKKKAKKAKKKSAEKPKEEKPKKDKLPIDITRFSKEEMLELAKAGLGAVGKFGRKLKVDRFLLHYTAAGKDPYNTAVTFAYVNAALSSLAPICSRRFTVKDCSVWTDVDFTIDEMKLDLGLAMSIRIGQIMAIVLAVGFKMLGILKRNKARLKAEAAAAPAAMPADANKAPDAGEAVPAITENSNKENIQAEERKDSNG